MEKFDRYKIYRKAVQSPEIDVVFLRDTYRELRGRNPVSLREDFCGTFAISCEWAKLGPKYKSFGVDIDPEPIEFGFENYYPELTPATQKRVKITKASVLEPSLPKADLVCAMNFSYFLFKTREQMKTYFSNVYRTLKAGGVFVTDCFGGPACQYANVDKTPHRGFTYYWEQASYDPVTSEALFHIHFKVKQANGKEKMHRHVFSYDWRMWSILELREIMTEVGFKKTHVYWEGSTRDGRGNGVFSRQETGEECDAWVAYVVGEK